MNLKALGIHIATLCNSVNEYVFQRSYHVSQAAELYIVTKKFYYFDRITG
jgi:hypothetical protein